MSIYLLRLQACGVNSQTELFYTSRSRKRYPVGPFLPQFISTTAQQVKNNDSFKDHQIVDAL